MGDGRFVCGFEQARRNRLWRIARAASWTAGQGIETAFEGGANTFALRTQAPACPLRFLRPAFADQPAGGGFLADIAPAALVVDPFLVRRLRQQPSRLWGELLYLRGLLGELIPPGLDGLPAAAVRLIGIHPAEGNAFNGAPRQPADFRLTRTSRRRTLARLKVERVDLVLAVKGAASGGARRLLAERADGRPANATAKPITSSAPAELCPQHGWSVWEQHHPAAER